MDLIEGLPISDGYNVILVVVDRLTKYGHFISLRHPFTAASVAKIFLDTVVRLHGVTSTILSDRDRIFTSNFWHALLTAVGSKLNYTTPYHLQTDGQSERVNQCLEHYLRCAVQDRPKHWHRWLAMAEFWYNSSYHTSIGKSPFKALYGVEPNFGALPNITVAEDSPAHDELTTQQDQTKLLREHLHRAQ